MVSKLSALLAIAATLPTAFAHYNFESLIVNGAPSGGL
ncbi:fungal cellulose binding domain-containing protein [Verticillium alfalfae VaMs.102]|uniref:Fungal cellulose binding domain-containing protein n=1 Tax=Verticillium alfalfae (strain VaMs.102 / ATCC MYA-4576 / FGSC 10136) TaxID=526221 RepID=C9SQP3_VERA1|nr:fungal cellulose binding domain-containing protein [Verticillium alfalfae VaMs.102]EEY21168.1 fungal cellulose binding domain-containing protein [Verticillium alfalfae VaMs.102]